MVISNHRRLVQMSFKSLVNALSEQRHEIKQALTLFPYFDTWDHKVIAECCQQSKIVEYSPDEIILGSGSANSHMAFFILEGVCKIIHHLLVRVKVDPYGRTSYNLYKPEDVGSSGGQSNNLSYSSMLFNEKHDFQKEEDDGSWESQTNRRITPKTVDQMKNGDVESGQEEKIQEETGSQKADSEVAENKEVEITLEAENLKISQSDHVDDNDDDDDDGDGNEDSEGHVHGEKIDSDLMENTVKEKSSSSSTEPEQGKTISQPSSEEKKHQEKAQVNSLEEKRERENVFEPDHHLRVLEDCKAKSKQIVRLADEKSSTEKPKDVKSFFVQVAVFYKGACFGLEENLKDTFIMSATKVKCLRIPRRFLLQHNPCNIWNRIRLFFSLYLPPEKQILEYVKSHRNWNNANRKKSQEIASLKRIPNYILCAEVPFSIRLQDMPR